MVTESTRPRAQHDTAPGTVAERGIAGGTTEGGTRGAVRGGPPRGRSRPANRTAPRSAPGASRTRPGLTGPPNRSDGRRPARADLSRRFAGLLLATLTGQRSATIMMRLTTSEVYDKVWALAEEGSLRHGPRTPSPRVVSCRHFAPTPGALEITAVVQASGRTRALAFRLEVSERHGWQCTALETG